MNSLLKVSALSLAVMLVQSPALAKDEAKVFEYTLNGSVYEIPASQADNLDEIIALIEANNDVSAFSVTQSKLTQFDDVNEADSATMLAGGNLRIYSELNTGYLNDFDQAFTYTCPNNMFVKSISSYHQNKQEDRRFSLVCAKFTTDSGSRIYRKTTKWSGYVNSYDQAFNFVCPNGQFLVGMSSRHDNGREDRLFNFNCASMATSSVGAALFAESCITTQYTGYDQPWTLGGNGALIGMSSRHDNRTEDRQTAVTYCSAASDW
ncbi:dermatopontin-like protein [Pseudoalteromonas piscicida]|uniref:dermatopontin-like protein n=1 Tax=Pseudoalteromonas piscicida TaxID=43662 RepID=UPI0030B7D54A